MTILLILYAAAFLFLMGTCYLKEWNRWYLPAKMIASALFVLIFLYRYLFHLPEGQWFALIPFLFCFTGDLLLGIRENAGGAPAYFVPGVLSFSLAHIGFCIVLSATGDLLRWQELIIPFLSILAVLLSCRFPGMNIPPKLMAWLLIYSFFVSLTLSKALCHWMLDGAPNHTVMLGTLLFLLSDIVLEYLYFFPTRPYSLKFINLFTYFSGVGLLAMGLV